MQRFIIVVPVYNSIQYIKHCLYTCVTQDYENFKVVVVDDCSDDGTWEVIKNFHVECYRNEERIGSGLANIIKGIELSGAEDNDVIVTVDGDDRLSGNGVLKHLNSVYTNDVWMTYGQYLPDSATYEGINKPVLNTQTYRYSSLWMTTHLRTFRKWLFDKIKDEDLRNAQGKYFETAWDRAFMYPLIGMAGKHCRFIEKTLYLYNDLNPFNDMKTKKDLGIEDTYYIKSKTPYKEL